MQHCPPRVFLPQDCCLFLFPEPPQSCKLRSPWGKCRVSASSPALQSLGPEARHGAPSILEPEARPLPSAEVSVALPTLELLMPLHLFPVRRAAPSLPEPRNSITHQPGPHTRLHHPSSSQGPLMCPARASSVPLLIQASTWHEAASLEVTTCPHSCSAQETPGKSSL